MRRYTKREVSRLLGEVMRGNPVSMLSFNLARVVRQMRRDLAGRTWRPIASAPRDAELKRAQTYTAHCPWWASANTETSGRSKTS